MWREFHRTRSNQGRNRLVEHYAPLVRTEAARIARRLPAQIELDEICSAGFDGLMRAIESYDPAKPACFETFCRQRIQGAVVDWLRSQDHQSRTIRMFEKQRAAAWEQLERELDRPPTDEELVERMGLTAKRFAKLSRISQVGQSVPFSSMDARMGTEGSNGSEERTWEAADPEAVNPGECMEQKMLLDILKSGLCRQERLLLALYYEEDLSMAEVGEALDLSESRVSQIHKNVLRQLRERYEARVAARQYGVGVWC
jgi:RNA polymerase sigma factor for flagellar operon FliA